MTEKKHNFANEALFRTSFGKDISLQTGPSDFKAANSKPKAKPIEKEEEPEFENPYDEFIKTWQQGDILPLIPPGMEFHLCKFKTNNFDTDAEYLGLQERYRTKPKPKVKGKSFTTNIDTKNLGPKLRNAVETVRQRALSRRGGLVPWVDENNKLRCPAGTPAANQFTDEMMSNCFILSPETLAGTGRRALRRAGAAADILGALPGQRVSTRTTPADIDVTTPEGIRKLGPSGAQALMSAGGRIAIATGATGAMGGGFGFRADPKSKKRSASKAWQLGVKEQIQRGQRLTFLADDLHKRIMNPSGPDGIKLPSGAPIGDIRNKANFMRAMQEVFPQVNPLEIEQLFDNAIPQNLSFLDRVKFRKSLVSYYEGLIFEAISMPENAKWMTRFEIDNSMGSAIEIKIEPFAPSITSGGRLSSIAAQKLATSTAAAPEGGVHFTMKVNPLQMFFASNGYGFSKNGRANGISDSARGDMLYTAVHEFGHISHFASVMRALGFGDIPDDPANRYQMARTLTPGAQTATGVPTWSPNVEVGGWKIDWTQASNPMNSPSIAALIQGAQNLQTRNYKGGNYGRGIYGFTRKDLEKDLSDFYDGFIEAIHNNITGTEDDFELMRAFSGGEYAAVNTIETHAEYFASRRLFGEIQDPRERARPGYGLPLGRLRRRNPMQGVNLVGEFATAWSTMPRNIGPGGTPIRTPVDIYRDMDRIGTNTSGVVPGNWNITGRMAGFNNRPTLKARAVRRAVMASERESDPNSAQWQRRSIIGRMASSTSFKQQNTAPSISPSLPEPLGLITPQRKEAGRSAKIVEDASKIQGVTWSQPVDAKELSEAISWSTNNIVTRFTWDKESVASGLPKLTEEQIRYLKYRTAGGRELTSKDVEDILGSRNSGGAASLYALIKQDAIERGDIAKAQRIDAFVERLQNMTPEEFKAMLPDLLKSNRSRSDSRVHVMMSNPALLEKTDRYLTIHDKKERDALGIGYTGFAQEEFTADVRRSVEQSFGLPYTESEDVRQLRPASGFVPQTDSHISRIEKLRRQYGDDIPIMHPYAMGQSSSDANGVEKYGLNMVVLRSEVAGRTKIMRGDSAANRNESGNAILPASEMMKPENASILHANSGASLLWDEMVGRGGLGSSSHKQRYNEAVVLGSFNLKDDVEAMVVSPDNFDLDADELEELGPGINPRVATPTLVPTRLVKAARFRDRMKNQHGIDTVVAVVPQRNNSPLEYEAFLADNVELFNPAMTKKWMSTYFPEADLEEVIPDDKTTPYEAFIRHSTKRFGSDTLFGQTLREEIERIDDQKLRTYGEVALGQATRGEVIDSRGLEDMPSQLRRSVIGRMSTQRVAPEQMVDVPEINKRGLATRKQKASNAENELARLEEALKILNETGEWRGGDLNVTATLVDDPRIDSFNPIGLVPNNRTATEIGEDIGAVKERVSTKIERLKKEIVLQKYLADSKAKRVKQNVLDLEDISPEEYAILKEEGRQLRELQTTDYNKFLDLVTPGTDDNLSEFVIHAGASELDGDALNPGKTEGDRYGGVVNNTQALNSQAIFNFIENRKSDIEIDEATDGVLKKLKAKESFTVDSPAESRFLQDIGFTKRDVEVGSTLNLAEQFGQNYDSAIKGYIERAEASKSRRKKSIKDTEKIAKALEENPKSGFLSASPASNGFFSTAGYFGRWSFRDIPKDVAEIDSDKPFATQEPPRKIVDDFMNSRWDANLRGTAWLVDGSKSITTNRLGPNSERQIVGTTKPIFGISAPKEKRTELDEVGFAVMARAMQLQKEGKTVNPQSVLEYRTPVNKRFIPKAERPTSVTGRMSSAISSVDAKQRIDKSVQQSESDIELSTQKLNSLEQALKVLQETGEWRGADFGVTPYDSNNWFGVGFDDPDFKPENLTAEQLASGRFGGIEELKKSVDKKIKESQKYIRIQKDLAQRKAIRREQNVLDVEDISDAEYAELLAEAEYIKSLASSSDEYKELFGPIGDEYFVQHSGSSELKGGVLNPALSVGSTQINPVSGGDTRGVNNLVRSRIDAKVKEFETDLSELQNLKKWADANPSGGTYIPTRGVFGSNSRSLSRNGYGRMDNDELVVSADRVAFLKEKVDKDIADINEKLTQGQSFLKKLDDHDGQHLSAYPAGKPVSTGGLGYFASQANSEIPEDIGVFPSQFQENNGVSRVVRDQRAADNWLTTRRGTLWLVSGKYNEDITSGFAGMANTPGDERQILGTQKPMFGISQVVGSDRTRGLDQIAPALVARAIKLKKERKDVSPETVLTNPLRRGVTGAMSSGEKPIRPKYPRTPTYGPGIGKGDSLFSEAGNWRDFKKAYEDKEIVFLDYETTGLVFDEFGKAVSNGAPVQIGAVKVKNGKVIDRFNVFINPGEKLGEWSRNNLKDRDGNPLTDEWLSNQPSIADAHKQLAEFAGADAIMGVQNASFDKNVLEDALKSSGIEWTPSGYIDTKEISSMVLPRWTPENPDGPAKMGADGIKRPSNGLKEITEYLGVDLGSKHHTADADAEATAEVMQKIIDMAIEKDWNDGIFSQRTRLAHVDAVNRKHRQEIEEFKIARDIFLAEIDNLANDKKGIPSGKGDIAKEIRRTSPLYFARSGYSDVQIEPEQFLDETARSSPPIDGPEAVYYRAMRAEMEKVGGWTIGPGGKKRKPGEKFTYTRGNPLYHVTTPEAFEKIATEGLSSNSATNEFENRFGTQSRRGKDVLFLASTPSVLDEEMPNIDGVVTLRINPDSNLSQTISDLPKTSDWNTPDRGSVVLEDVNIKPELIEFLNSNGDWVSLGESRLAQRRSATGSMAAQPVSLLPKEIPSVIESDIEYDPQLKKGSDADIFFQAMQKEISDVGGLYTNIGGVKKGRRGENGEKGHMWKEGMPVYHATSISALDSIKQNGLKNGGPKSPSGPLWVVSTPGAWDKNIPLWLKDGAVFLRIKPEGQMLEKLRERSASEEKIMEQRRKDKLPTMDFGNNVNNGVITLNNVNISPDSIEILDKSGKWVPLNSTGNKRNVAEKLQQGPATLEFGRNKVTGTPKIAPIDELKDRYGLAAKSAKTYFKDKYNISVTGLDSLWMGEDRQHGYYAGLQALEDVLSNVDMKTMFSIPEGGIHFEALFSNGVIDGVVDDKSIGAYTPNKRLATVNLERINKYIDEIMDNPKISNMSKNGGISPKELFDILDLPFDERLVLQIGVSMDRIDSMRLTQKDLERKQIAARIGYAIVVHEMAHALDHAAGIRSGTADKMITETLDDSTINKLTGSGAVSTYGAKNVEEGMAEAFTAWWLFGDRAVGTKPKVGGRGIDEIYSPYLDYLFNQLSDSVKSLKTDKKTTRNYTIADRELPDTVKQFVIQSILQRANRRITQNKIKSQTNFTKTKNLIYNPYNEKVLKAFSSVEGLDVTRKPNTF